MERAKFMRAATWNDSNGPCQGLHRRCEADSIYCGIQWTCEVNSPSTKPM
jgi:hypothetical protein